jgi:Fe-S-cluster containining protein
MLNIGINMFENMKKFLLSDVCLSCDGCCRFDREKSDWRPKVGKVEAEALSENGMKAAVEKGGYLQDKLCRDIYACTFFNLDDTTCTIYPTRPFECRLYPFVLTKKNGQQSVCVHLNCPYVDKNKGSEAYAEHIAYLKEFFREPEVVSLLRGNPHLFGDYLGYEDELEWIFNVA